MKTYEGNQRTIGYLLEDKSRSNKDKTFLYFEDKQITYEEINERANRVANGFLKIGIKKGDKVCIMMPNCPEFLYAWFGLAKMGAIMVPINNALKGDGLSYIINHSDAETMVINHQFLPSFKFVEADLKHIKKVIVDAQEAPKGFQMPSGSISYNELLKSPPPTPQVEINPAEVVEIIYTSGTTGLPKGVMISHSYCTNLSMKFAEHLGYTPDDILYTALPLFHGNAQIVTTLTALFADCQVALSRRFSASKFWDEIRRYKATEFNYIGGIIPILYNQPPREDDADNPVRISIGAAAPKNIWRDFEKRFNLELVEFFGLTEGAIIWNKPGEGKLGSLGKPTPFNEIKIFDDDDNEVAPGTMGEIVARPTEQGALMSGYYKMPEKTLEAFRNLWFHTGDYGYKDEEGYFYFVDRKKDSLRRRGENISSFEIEKIVNKHPKVLESAAIGVPAELGEDDVKLCVVLKPDQKLSPEVLLSFCEERMAYFMVPRYVEFKESFPKTGTERVEKYKLKKEGVTQNTWDREKAGYKLKR